MAYPEKAAVNENAPGVSKLKSSPEENRVSDGQRSELDERRFQNALEDDEVREALQILRGTRPAARIKRRP